MIPESLSLKLTFMSQISLIYQVMCWASNPVLSKIQCVLNQTIKPQESYFRKTMENIQGQKKIKNWNTEYTDSI